MKFRFMMQALTAVALSQFATGCAVTNAATTEKSALEKTTAYFGAKPGEVVIAAYEKQALTTTYQARFKGVMYNCVIYYGQVNCKKPGA
jgi:hypothetical protein